LCLPILAGSRMIAESPFFFPPPVYLLPCSSAVQPARYHSPHSEDPTPSQHSEYLISRPPPPIPLLPPFYTSPQSWLSTFPSPFLFSQKEAVLPRPSSLYGQISCLLNLGAFFLNPFNFSSHNLLFFFDSPLRKLSRSGWRVQVPPRSSRQ